MKNDDHRIIATVRGTETERADLQIQAAIAKLSLNQYIRQKLGLPTESTRTKPKDKQ